MILIIAFIAVHLTGGTRAFVMAGESVRFDEKLLPHFTENQMLHTSLETRTGLVRWAETAGGRDVACRVLFARDQPAAPFASGFSGGVARGRPPARISRHEARGRGAHRTICRGSLNASSPRSLPRRSRWHGQDVREVCERC